MVTSGNGHTSSNSVARVRSCFAARRWCHGHSFIEVGLIAGLVAVLAMFCVNVSILLIGSTVNDAACRDAARAAAQAQDVTSAQTFAKAALAAYPSSPFITAPVIDGEIDYQPPAIDPITGEVDKRGKPPYVTVNTKTTVTVPAPFLLFGMQFNAGGTMTFKQRYRYPILSVGEPLTPPGS